MSRRRKFYRNEPVQASKWMLNYLIKDKNKTRKLKVSVYFRNMIEDTGRCYDRTKTHFVIVLSPDMSRNESLRVLAHECVHIAQFVTGKLFIKNGEGHWKSKIYKETDDMSYAAYRALPWEKEAFRRQSKVAKAYKEWLSNRI
jgi:hypothetical protein